MKLLISDYDGTFKTDIKNIKLNVEAIQEFRRDGNHFAIATGRGFDSIKNEIKEYEIPYDYLITNDGSLIFNGNDNLVYAFNEGHKVLSNLQRGLEARGYKLKVYTVPNAEEIVELEISLKPFEKFIDMNAFIKENPGIVQITIQEGLKKYIFFKQNTDKSVAIKKLLELQNIKYDLVTAIGNDSNDVSMLRDFKGYKMKKSERGLMSHQFPSIDQVHTLIKKIR